MNALAKRKWNSGPRAGADAQKVSMAVVREALVQRIEEFLRDSIAHMSDEELMAVIAAPTPGETIARVVASTPYVAVERDGWTQALLRGALLKQDALRAAGGILSSGEVAQLLGITIAGVKQRQRRGKLLGVPTSNGEWAYPARQFNENGSVREGLALVIEAFGTDTDPWIVLSFLANPVPGADSGIAFDALSDPDATSTLIEVARTYGEQGAA